MKKKQFYKMLFVAAICIAHSAAKAQNTYPYPQTGDVGIGTASPIGRFDVNPGGWGNLLKISFSQQSDNPSMRLYRPTGATSPVTFYPWWIENNGGVGLQFKNGAIAEAGAESVSAMMTLANNGNVGIGTTTPDEKLSVYGKVHAREVKVDLSVPGPDYVFKKDYNLPTLKDVETYISQNQHLPEIASAADMKEQGIELGDMNIRLLKKIEELTLYMIQQNKTIENQSAQISALLTGNKEFKTELEKLKAAVK